MINGAKLILLVRGQKVNVTYVERRFHYAVKNRVYILLNFVKGTITIIIMVIVLFGDDIITDICIAFTVF